MESKTSKALRKVIRSLTLAAEAPVSDGELLRRFAREDDQAAFTTLFRRHAPMVLGTCRRALPTVQDAEDACQATFLLLARKAKGGRWQDSVANWLYATARKVAANASCAARRRARREARAGKPEAVAPADITAKQLLAALDEELDKLPALYREPLLLCYLQGLTRDQAAYRLGVPLGTIKTRLERGRKKLHDALTNRGLSLGAGLLVLAATSQAGLSAPLSVETILETVSGRAPAAVVTLTKGVGMNALINKSKLLLLTAIAVVGLGFGLASMSHTAATSPFDRAMATETGCVSPAAVDALGDPLPTGAVGRLGTVRLRHGDYVFFAAYTRDGKGLLTAGIDQTLRLWQLPEGKELRRFDWGKATPTGESPPWTAPVGTRARTVYPVALSPDHKTVAAVREGSLFLWDTSTGKFLYPEPIKGFEKIDYLFFIAGGKELLGVNGRDGSTLVWDVATGKNTRRLAKLSMYGMIGKVAVSPNGKYLAWITNVEANRGDIAVKIKELAADRELGELPTANQFSGVLTFSADSKVLAWYAPNGSLVLWDVGAHKERLRLALGTRQIVNAIAVSANAQLVAVSDMEIAEVWDAETGKKIAVASSGRRKGSGLPTGMQYYGALAFAPDARTLAASFGDSSIIQFDAGSGKPAARSPDAQPTAVSLLGWSGDDSILTFSHGAPLSRWSLATGRSVGHMTIAEDTQCAACSADGQRLAAAAGNTVTVYDAAGKVLRRREGKELRQIGEGTSVWSLALSPDGRVLALREAPMPAVRLWDTATGKDLVTLAQSQATEDPAYVEIENGEAWGMMTPELVFSPDGRSVFGAGARRQLIRWDCRSVAVVWTVTLPAGVGQAVERLALSASGHSLATLNGDGSISIYETATGHLRAHFGKADVKRGEVRSSWGIAGVSVPLYYQSEPFALAFSPDGRYLVSAKGAPVIRIWDVRTGKEVGQLSGHQGGIVSLRFAPDGKRLLSGSRDTTALIWDTTRILKNAPSGAKLDTKTLDALWTDLGDKDAAKAFSALCRLSESPAQAAALVKKQVRPAVAPPHPKSLATLIVNLGSDNPDLRGKARDDIEVLGELVEPQLRKALAEAPSAAWRLRLELQLRRIVTHPPDSLVRDLRAVELLELAGGADARRVLDDLSGGAAGARLTREARAAAQRLAK